MAPPSLPATSNSRDDLLAWWHRRVVLISDDAEWTSRVLDACVQRELHPETVLRILGI